MHTARGSACRQRQQPGAAAGAFAVDHRDAFAQAALGQQRVRLARSLVGSRDAAREVDRHDVAAGLDQGLPHRQEIADRGLRGGRQLGVAAQALVEAVEAVHLELALAALLPADVQAHLVDAFAVGQRPR